MRFLLLVSFLFFSTSELALAAVSINEVAWMGGLESANHEWIELYNDSETAVAVDGWTLQDGMNLTINLIGTIGPKSYAVLERTSEESAAGTAFLLYTGALVNTGATLVLKDSASLVVDQVAGGVDWQNIGGDNTTKETAQYSTTGWVTDTPTPSAQNGSGRVVEAVVDTPAEVNTTTASISSGSSKSSKKSSSSVKINNPETKMTLVIDGQSVAYVNQTVTFNVNVGGVDNRAQNKLRYEWNFGDTYATSGKKVKHTYAYPGTYVVTVYGRREKNEQTSRHEITVLPVNFSISHNDVGDIQIHNDAAYDVDISGYVLRGLDSIVLPPRTIILPRSTITIEASRLGGIEENLIALYDTKRTLVTSTYENNDLDEEMLLVEADDFLSEARVGALTGGAASAAPPVNAPDTSLTFSPKIAEANTLVGEQMQVNNDTPNVQGSEKSTPFNPNTRWPYLVFIALLLAALVGIFVNQKRQ